MKGAAISSVARVWRALDRELRRALIKPMLFGAASAVILGALDIALLWARDAGHLPWDGTGGMLLIALLALIVISCIVTTVLTRPARRMVIGWMARYGVNAGAPALGASTLKVMAPIAISNVACFPQLILLLVVGALNGPHIWMALIPLIALIRVVATIRALASQLGK